MPRTATATKNGKTARPPELDSEIKEEELQAEEKDKQRGAPVNPLMQRLSPEMLTSPYPVEMRNGRTMNSFDFALAKLDQMIAQPLGIESEEQWIVFARHLFSYRKRVEEQRVEEQVNKLLEDSRQNPAILQRLVQRLNLELAATQNTTAVPAASVFPEEFGTRTPLDVSRYS